MPYKKEHSARVADPDLFIKDSFIRKNIFEGVDIIFGKLENGDDSLVAQAYIFNAEQFAIEKVMQWLKKNSIETLKIEPATMDDVEDKETFQTIKDIFSVGTWNGDTYTGKDIEEIINNFSDLSRTNKNYKVPLKIDFFKNTKQGDYHGGQPAVGWITKLEKIGSKMFAHITNIPRKVKEIIDNKSYRQVSSEIAINMKNEGKKIGKVLTGVALLGIEGPGVRNLEDFTAIFTDNGYEVKKYIYKGDEKMTEEIKKLEEDNQTLQAQVEEQRKFIDKINEEKKIEQEIKAKEKEDSAKAVLMQFIESKKSEGKIIPAQEETIKNIFEAIDAGKMVKFTNADNAEEQKPVTELFKEFLNDLPVRINFSQKSQNVADGQDEPVIDENMGDKESQLISAKANKYAKENNCSFSEALIAVSKEVKK